MNAADLDEVHGASPGTTYDPAFTRACPPFTVFLRSGGLSSTFSSSVPRDAPCVSARSGYSEQSRATAVSLRFFQPGRGIEVDLERESSLKDLAPRHLAAIVGLLRSSPFTVQAFTVHDAKVDTIDSRSDRLNRD